MPPTKSAARFCSCTCSRNSFAGLPLYASAPLTSPLHTSSSVPRSPSISKSKSPLRRDGRRSHATMSNPSNGPAQPPSAWPKNPNPTPYDILSVKRGEAYTKQRFHELVKTYHPDRHTHTPDIQSLPKAVRLERYRLIVAAHDLLSDPSKRRLYDTRGVGWTGDRAPTLNESARHAEFKWRDQPGNAARNATWEDWERWYQARDGKPQEAVYTSNGFFATLVILACMGGALTHMYYADQVGAEYLDMMNQTNLTIGQQMARSTLVASGRSKDQRVDSFLRERENLNYSFSTTKYDDWPAPESGQPSQPGQPGQPGQQGPPRS